MPLTKSEFDRWKAQADEASVQMADTPAIHELALIYRDGFLRIMQGPTGLGPVETRALYEMLRAWYGESSPSPAMTEATRSLLAAAVVVAVQGSIVKRDEWDQFVQAAEAYRAEQKQ